MRSEVLAGRSPQFLVALGARPPPREKCTNVSEMFRIARSLPEVKEPLRPLCIRLVPVPPFVWFTASASRLQNVSVYSSRFGSRLPGNSQNFGPETMGQWLRSHDAGPDGKFELNGLLRPGPAHHPYHTTPIIYHTTIFSVKVENCPRGISRKPLTL